jgi:hypothetical protein
MKDIISKDPKIAELLKQKDLLQRQLRAVSNKVNLGVERVLRSKLKTALGAHKWKLSSADNDYYEKRESKIQEIFLEIVGDEEKSGGIILSKTATALNTSNPLRGISKNGPRYRAKSMMKKGWRSKPANDIKNFRDFMSISERWDVSSFSYGMVYISFSYSRVRISSSCGSMDDIYSAIRKLEIPLDISMQISDIEKMELDLRKRKELMQDLSSKSLFSL